MTPKAVLFDFDGVIADTENIHVAAWQRTLARMGWEVADETCARAAEVDDRVFVAELFEHRKIEGADLDGWLARKQALTEVMLADAPRVYPGVAALIDALLGRARLGVVTSTWRGNVAAVLQAIGRSDSFEVIVAKEDVARVKPDPEGYALALKRLGLNASEVVALEDSPIGIAAARGAGLRVVAVGHRRPAGAWSVEVDYLAGLDDGAAALAAIGLSGGLRLPPA